MEAQDHFEVMVLAQVKEDQVDEIVRMSQIVAPVVINSAGTYLVC